MADSTDNDNDNDSDLFRRVMADVTPMPEDNRIEPAAGARRATVRQDTLTASPATGFIQSDYVPPVLPEESLFFTRPGLQEKVRKRLRQGQFPIEARLDLHGKTIAEAGQQLDDFLHHARLDNLRCVLVVHGRGHRSQDKQPVLKAHVNHWLREHTDVLAFASALPGDGGVGAVYVLVKKAK